MAILHVPLTCLMRLKSESTFRARSSQKRSVVRHDVWGAGLCLFLMLAGRLPRRAAKFLDFQDFCDEVQGTSVECVGSCWQEVSENCKACGERRHLWTCMHSHLSV